jgi:hypothetical protein
MSKSYPAAFTVKFNENLGLFYGMWLAMEATVDYLIGRYLKLPHEETHILTAGMEFGRKANLLRVAVTRSTDPNKELIKDLLSKIQNESKRNLFSHSLINSSDTHISFIHRKNDGVYTATETKFTPDEFQAHCRKVAKLAQEFHNATNLDNEDFQAFGKAALSAAKRATISP